MKVMRVGQAIQYRAVNNRVRCGIVTAVTSNDVVTVRLAHTPGTTLVTRVPSTKTRCTIFAAGS